jgi:hypothetical protein
MLQHARTADGDAARRLLPQGLRRTRVCQRHQRRGAVVPARAAWVRATAWFLANG